ncbi:phosphosulfolactate synthase [Hysterangium stoloniferum]|nr:phosphosulfolactate synthase [Hysterangium stoloniferum]
MNLSKGALRPAKAGFDFIASNPLPPKPRLAHGLGVTEIRGPYYNAAFGPTVLADTLKIASQWVDGLKFAGGGFTLMPADVVREMTDIAHKHDIYVSTGGFVERLLATSNDRVRDVERYVKQCKNLGFDVIELSTGFLSLPVQDWAELVQCVQNLGMKAKPELGIQWGAGGDASITDLERAGTSDVGGLIDAGKVLIDAGAEMLMIESEGITENVVEWRTDVLSSIIHSLPLTKLMFEAADPKVFEWYIQNHGVDVNLFVDHSQAIQLACLRAGIWGTNQTFGRIVNFRSWKA